MSASAYSMVTSVYTCMQVVTLISTRQLEMYDNCTLIFTILAMGILVAILQFFVTKLHVCWSAWPSEPALSVGDVTTILEYHNIISSVYFIFPNLY